MTLPVRLHPSAEQEARSAFEWNLERSEQAAAACEELSLAMERIGDEPATYPAIESQLRRYTLQSFPYSLLYAVGVQSITILAVAHPRRRPGYWRDR